MKTFPSLALGPSFLLTLVLLILLSGCIHKNKRVMVKAWSDEEYRSNIPEGEMPPPETYALYRGQFESGQTRDNSLLGESQFRKISGFLKNALETQNYVMIRPNEPMDLLIVVHWGLTSIDTETHYFEFEDEEGYIETEEFEQITEESLRKNALILGTTEKIYLDDFEPDQEEVIASTSEERYFFALVAFDANDLLQRKKTIKWRTQFSVDTTGTNHLDALPAMARVAQNYFGKNSEDLNFERTHLGKGEVELGDVEVLGVMD